MLSFCWPFLLLPLVACLRPIVEKHKLRCIPPRAIVRRLRGCHAQCLLRCGFGGGDEAGRAWKRVA